MYLKNKKSVSVIDLEHRGIPDTNQKSLNIFSVSDNHNVSDDKSHITCLALEVRKWVVVSISEK